MHRIERDHCWSKSGRAASCTSNASTAAPGRGARRAPRPRTGGRSAPVEPSAFRRAVPPHRRWHYAGAAAGARSTRRRGRPHARACALRMSFDDVLGYLDSLQAAEVDMEIWGTSPHASILFSACDTIKRAGPGRGGGHRRSRARCDGGARRPAGDRARRLRFRLSRPPARGEGAAAAGFAQLDRTRRQRADRGRGRSGAPRPQGGRPAALAPLKARTEAADPSRRSAGHAPADSSHTASTTTCSRSTPHRPWSAAR